MFKIGLEWYLTLPNNDRVLLWYHQISVFSKYIAHKLNHIQCSPTKRLLLTFWAHDTFLLQISQFHQLTICSCICMWSNLNWINFNSMLMIQFHQLTEVQNIEMYNIPFMVFVNQHSLAQEQMLNHLDWTQI